MKPKLLILIGFVIAVAAVSYTALSRPSSPATPAEMLAALGKFKERACACRDAACGDALGKELEAWTAQIANADKPSDEDVAKLGALAKQVSSCLERASAPAGSGSASGAPSPATR